MCGGGCGGDADGIPCGHTGGCTPGYSPNGKLKKKRKGHAQTRVSLQSNTAFQIVLLLRTFIYPDPA